MGKKIRSQTLKASKSTTGSLGCRVVGGKWKSQDGGFVRVGHKHGNEVASEEELSALLLQFLCTESLRNSALQRLQDVATWWRSQARYAFYASSLLFAYDTERKDECRVNIIDFANCETISEKC